MGDAKMLLIFGVLHFWWLKLVLGLVMAGYGVWSLWRAFNEKR
jgi:hypothetical protein